MGKIVLLADNMTLIASLAAVRIFQGAFSRK